MDLEGHEVSVVVQRLSYPSETVLSGKITVNRIVLSFKNSPRKTIKTATYDKKSRDSFPRERKRLAVNSLNI